MNFAAKVFRRAAGHVDAARFNTNGDPLVGTCSAITVAILQEDPQGARAHLDKEIENLFADLFRPSQVHRHGYWWDLPWLCTEEEHNARVLALLFAEQIALDIEQELAGVP